MKKGSVILTAVFVVLCMAAVVLLTGFAPFIADRYVEWRDINPQLKTIIPLAFDMCAVPALAALVCLLLLLRNILNGNIFIGFNSFLMSVVSWCCIAVTLVTAVFSYWYMPFIFVTAAFIFIFLIVRVVRGCFKAAITLREENELTI